MGKIHFFKFLSLSEKPRLLQLKIITSTRSTVQASLTAQVCPSVRRNTIKEGENTLLRTNTKPHQLIKYAKISYSIASLVFHKFSYGTYRNGLNQGTSKLRKAEELRLPQKVRIVLVWYHLSESRILVHSCAGRSTSKKKLYMSQR